MKRRPMTNKSSRKSFRRGSKVNKKNGLNSTSGAIMRGGIRF